MSLIEITQTDLTSDYKKNCSRLLTYEKYLVDHHYDWIQLSQEPLKLTGSGELKINNDIYQITLYYSPLFPLRFDRIYITNRKIEYNSAIHIYKDGSLCLYHPIFDRPLFRIIPLFKMIPWITEWCIHYEEWKKYGVWLGKEFKH